MKLIRELFAAGCLLSGFDAIAQSLIKGTSAPTGQSQAAPLRESPFLPNAVLTEGFDVVTGGCVSGWNCQNLSNPTGTIGWFQGDTAVFNAQAGAANAYIAANFNNTVLTNTISNWLITPQVNFNPGAQLRFWTRTSTGQFPDRLEVRVSTNGASTDVGTTNASVGDFTTTLITINPSLLAGAGACPPGAGAYPTVFCEIVIGSAQGLPTSGSGRIAFRYFMPNAGPQGANSLYIGIDTFSYDDAAVTAETVFGITGDSAGASLIRFVSNAPASVTTIGALSGIVTGHSVRAIDFRPADGRLYALSTNLASSYQLYTVNLTTAALTPVGPVGNIAGSFPATVSMDFNPVADRLRVVTGDVAGGGAAAARSYRINPNDGSLVAEDSALAYVAGDPNAANNPPVPTGVAYDRSDTNPSTATTMFAWDFRFDTLARVGSVDGTPNSPNGGQLSTIFTQPTFLAGNAGLGFDVSASGMAYLSYVAFVPGTRVRGIEGSGGPETFARVNLATGAVTVIGNFAAGTNVLDIAAQLPVPAAVADLSASLVDSPDPIAPGNNLNYTVTATNNGPSPAAAVSISLPLPAGTNFAAITPSSGGTCNFASPVLCTWGAATAVGAANARSVVVVAGVPAGTAVGTVFNATATVATTSIDANPGNNSATQATTVGTASADLAITLTDAPDPVVAGTNLAYTATVTNNGPTDAQNVSISLTLPAGTSFVSATASAGGSCNAVSPVVCSWAGATIPTGVRTANVVALVSAAQVASLSATVAATSATSDPNSGNNNASAATAVRFAANIPISPETEPNNSAATSSPLLLTSGWSQASATITPAGDLDFFSVPLSAGQRLWILSDTGGPQAAGATSTDSFIDLLAPDGTTVVESDDDDGTGNGGDGSVETVNASAIAGRAITANGTHFIRLRAFNANDLINPVNMFVARTAAANQTAEVEGNNTAATANVITTGINVRTASIGVAGDFDFYRVSAAAGDIIYYAADGDPERDGTGTDLVLELRAADGTTILQTINSAVAGSLADPASESSRFNVITAGNYFIVARLATGAIGSYHLMVANGPAPENIYGITGDVAGASLVRFASNAPATVTTVGTLSGVIAGHSVRAIDFRPADGRLYALSTNLTTSYQLYTVNLTTAALTPVGAAGTVATPFPATVSMDFNPVADRLRVVTGDVAGGGFAPARSYRINPANGSLVAEDTALTYVAGDPNAGNNPPVPTGVAYDRNDSNPATATTMYLWDFRFDTLSRVGSVDGTPNSPNTGQLTTILSQPVFLSGNVGLGLDVGPGAIAYLSYVAAPPTTRGTGGTETLSRINLGTGVNTVIGSFPAGLNVLDIAVELPPGDELFRNGFE